jgi:lipopolysaccharide assembly outer membrane protein LptD (OstA)
LRRALALCAVLASPAFCGDSRAPVLAPDFLDFGGQSDAPYVVNGDVLTHDRTNATATAEGNASVSRGGEVLRADSVRVTMTNRMAYAEGNVSVTRGEDVLKCDRLRMDMSNNLAWAEGHVELKRGNEVWTGESLTYDFKTRRTNVSYFEGTSSPFRIWAQRVEQTGTNVVALHDAILSTCTNDKDHLHFYIKAKKLTVTQGESLKVSGATWYIGPVPVLYLPGWYRDMSSHVGFRLKPGYASKWGGFLLTSYLLEPWDWLESETHLDIRTRRGLAGGQDFTWRSTNGCVSGGISIYYANDSDPVDSNDNRVREDLDNSRYRLHLAHEWAMSARDQFKLNLEYLSDTDVLEDFFGREFRRQRLPDNHVAAVHRGEEFTAGALFSMRLNDFYSVVERRPEFTFDLFRAEAGDSGLYFEGEASASMLARTVARTVRREPYDSGRLDTYGRAYYPFSPFSGGSLVPRAGYRLTYYTDTPVTNAGGVVTGGGSVLRSVPELGMAASMRLFRTWPDGSFPLRHTIEPYLDFTRMFRPSAATNEIYQFDDIDDISEETTVKVGFQNTLQTKRDGNPYTIAEVNMFTTVNLDPAPGATMVDVLSVESEVTPSDALRFDVDIDYSRSRGEMDTVDARATYDAKGSWLLSASYLARRDRYRLLGADGGMRFGAGWRALVFGRYEFVDGRMQEQGITFRRALDCMTFDVELSQIPAYTLDDGTRRSAEWTVSFTLVFTAFPELGIGGHGGGGGR